MLEKKIYGKLPKYYVYIDVKPTDDKTEIYAKWNATIRWNTNNGTPKEFLFEHSETVTETGGSGGLLDPTPGKSSKLEISIDITKWSVTRKRNQKRAREPSNSAGEYDSAFDHDSSTEE